MTAPNSYTLDKKNLDIFLHVSKTRKLQQYWSLTINSQTSFISAMWIKQKWLYCFINVAVNYL